MTAIKIPEREIHVAMRDAVARVTHCYVIRGPTLEDVLTDDLAIAVRLGPMSVHADIQQAEALGHALLSIAAHVRDSATSQLVTP
ncbi:hypothetical protein P3W33_17955 [Luteibacter sp. PPL552]